MDRNNGNNKQNKVENDSKIKLEELNTLVNDYTNSLKRLQADFENYTKRVEKEKQEFSKYASHKLALKLLNVLDDFERTLDVMKESEKQELKQGIEMMHKQLNKILAEEGVKRIEALGKKFDPYMHEVLDTAEGKEDDVVLKELQKGYLMHDKVLRTCKVRISKSQEQTAATITGNSEEDN